MRLLITTSHAAAPQCGPCAATFVSGPLHRVVPSEQNESPAWQPARRGFRGAFPKKSVSGILREIRCYVELLLRDRKQHLMRLGL